MRSAESKNQKPFGGSSKPVVATGILPPPERA
jgi:hypothetical protein